MPVLQRITRQKYMLTKSYNQNILFNWISVISNFILGFFKRNTEAECELEKKKIKPTRKRRKNNKQTFSYLLDSLEETFESVRTPSLSHSWIGKDDIIALKKIGAHVPHNKEEYDRLYYSSDASLDLDDGRYPSIINVSTGLMAQYSDEKKIYPSFGFAFREDKLPYFVKKHPGIPYRFGEGFKVDGRIFWTYCYLTIHNGKILLCDELRIKNNQIRSKTQKTLVSFPIKKWESPSILFDDIHSKDEMRWRITAHFVTIFNWWKRRNYRWSISVRKNGEKITFGIEDNDAREYFKDREKTALAPDGKAKRIIHICSEHTRTLRNGEQTTVREHVRGLRKFNWNGYECQVNTPKFKGLLTSQFDLPCESFDDNEMPAKGKYMSGSKLAITLSREEDKY